MESPSNVRSVWHLINRYECLLHPHRSRSGRNKAGKAAARVGGQYKAEVRSLRCMFWSALEETGT